MPIFGITTQNIYKHAIQLAKQSNNNDFATMLAAATSAAPAATTPTTPTTSSASSSVDISQLARQLLLGDASNDIAQIGKPVEYTGAVMGKARMSWLSQVAHADAGVAETLARDFAMSSDGVLLDMREAFSYTGPPRYLATGEPVNDATEKYLQQVLPAIAQMRKQVYYDERAKGTPPAEIMDKMVASMNSLPDRVRTLLCWDKQMYDPDKLYI